MILNTVTGKEVDQEISGIYILKSYERILIPPKERKIIILPYFIRRNAEKYLFDLDFYVATKGICFIASNININDNKEITIILENINKHDKIDILSGTIIGRILRI